MRLHRFYTAPEIQTLTHDFWLHDEDILKQWLKVLRYREGSQVVLFDGVQHERLYEIDKIDAKSAHLTMVTEFERKLPERHIYLFWSLLKKDKNDWVLQKGTELGVGNFIPILAERSEKTGFNESRALKIVTEAAEQCGRSDIPHVREPLSLHQIISEYGDKVTLLVCDERANRQPSEVILPAGVLIGPEGGWTDEEIALFENALLKPLHLGPLTLRAETAAVVAAVKLLQ